MTDPTHPTGSAPAAAAAAAPAAAPAAVAAPEDAVTSNLEPGTDSSDGGYGSDGYASSVLSSTQSLQSSIYRYIEENGRTYHAFNSGKYMLPNDDREQSRLDLQHHSFRIMLDGSLVMKPVPAAKYVLDLATGTGIWAIEYAHENPNAVVIGTDLSPIQPDYIPANCQFQVADAEEEWTFAHPFDFIHARAIVTCFKDNAAMARRIYDALTPGGVFELQDPSIPMRSDDGSLAGTALQRWNELVVSGMARIGRDVTDSPNWAAHLKAAGFVDIVERRVYVPVSPWARGRKNKMLGAISQQNLLEGIVSISMAVLTRVLGWSMAEVDPFLEDVRKDLQDKRVHAYGVVFFVSARKPAVGETAAGLAQEGTIATDPVNEETAVAGKSNTSVEASGPVVEGTAAAAKSDASVETSDKSHTAQHAATVASGEAHAAPGAMEVVQNEAPPQPQQSQNPPEGKLV